MNLNTFPDPGAPLAALDDVWNSNKEVVHRFQLSRPISSGVTGTSWFVLVRCDADNPNAHDLVTALRMLEREIELRSGLDVTLMLTTSLPTTNGTHH